MNSARCKEIDAFLNPIPVSASKMLENEGLNQDDGEHMFSFFKKTEGQNEPEMNRRNIMPEIEMTGQAYQAKKVTRDGLKR